MQGTSPTIGEEFNALENFQTGKAKVRQGTLLVQILKGPLTKQRRDSNNYF